MKRCAPKTASLFPELSTGPENPWITGTSSRTGENPPCGLTTLELCAGAGGQALGLERAGIEHAGLVEINKSACATLRLNRPAWNVIEEDLNTFDGSPFKGVDLISGGAALSALLGSRKATGTRRRAKPLSGFDPPG